MVRFSEYIIFVIQTSCHIVAMSKYDTNLNITMQDFEAKILYSENWTICDIWIPILQICQCLKIKSWHFDVAHSYFPASAFSAPFNSINTKSFHHHQNIFQNHQKKLSPSKSCSSSSKSYSSSTKLFSSPSTSCSSSSKSFSLNYGIINNTKKFHRYFYLLVKQ